MLDKNLIGKEELGILVLPLTSIPDLGNKLERATVENMENAQLFYNVFDCAGSPQGGKVGFWPLINKAENIGGVIHMEF